MKVLVADDSSLARRLLSQMLSKWGYEVLVCANGEEAWKALHDEGAPALAIVDWVMPGLSGLELCRRIRAESREPYVYVILLTANEQKEGVVEGLEAGADDYLRKPFDDQELEVRVRAGERIVDLQSQLVAAREAMRTQATHDSLTGLWNRGAVNDALLREFVRGERDGWPLTVLMVDLDHFKSVNDTFGHPVGDAVLCEAARRLGAGIRVYDVAGRYGGEEFLVLLAGCGRAAARERATLLCKAVGSKPMLVCGQTILQTVSVGCAVHERGDEGDCEGLLKSADDALYQAKHRGRNRVSMAGEAPS